MPDPSLDSLRASFTNFHRACDASDAETAPEGVKHDDEKTRYDLIPPLSLDALARVLTFGARKYAPENWRKVPDARRRYFSAALRHTWAWWRGEKLDAESGEHHLAHALCCIAFALELELEEEKKP